MRQDYIQITEEPEDGFAGKSIEEIVIGEDKVAIFFTNNTFIILKGNAYGGSDYFVELQDDEISLSDYNRDELFNLKIITKDQQREMKKREKYRKEEADRKNRKAKYLELKKEFENDEESK